MRSLPPQRHTHHSSGRSNHHHGPSLRHAAGGSRRKTAAYRQRIVGEVVSGERFSAPEVWHEPRGGGRVRYLVQSPGAGYVHPVTVEEVQHRIRQLPQEFTRNLEVVQFSTMTRKRRKFPCYGMQWGRTVYLYPIEATLVERYVAPPKPAQQIEARMYGGAWNREPQEWTLTWNAETLRDFYLNNVLIHEIGHLNDPRNTRSIDRERYANWFAIEYGYRASRNGEVTLPAITDA